MYVQHNINKYPKYFGKRPHRCLVTPRGGKWNRPPRALDKHIHVATLQCAGRHMYPLKRTPNGPHPTRDSLDPRELAPQTASRSIQPVWNS